MQDGQRGDWRGQLAAVQAGAWFRCAAESWLEGETALLLLAPAPVILAIFQRAGHRYALRDTSLQVMRGVLSQRDWIVPIESIQTLTVRRSWLQRRLGVATVTVDTAGASGWHRPDVSDVPFDSALALARALTARGD